MYVGEVWALKDRSYSGKNNLKKCFEAVKGNGRYWIHHNDKLLKCIQKRIGTVHSIQTGVLIYNVLSVKIA